MESTSAVTGPKITGPRGALRLEVIDREGSISKTGCETPETTRPDDESVAAPALLEVPGPVLTKPPSMLPPMMMALPASGLLPRELKAVVPVRAIWPALIKAPPDDAGQVRPDVERPLSLAQEWMPPRVCTPIRPGPTPDRAD